MDLLSIPTMSLGIPVYYIDPPANTPPDQLKPYMSLTLVRPVPTSSSFASVP